MATDRILQPIRFTARIEYGAIHPGTLSRQRARYPLGASEAAPGSEGSPWGASVRTRMRLPRSTLCASATKHRDELEHEPHLKGGKFSIGIRSVTSEELSGNDV
jgi:hypothetical protein